VTHRMVNRLWAVSGRALRRAATRAAAPVALLVALCLPAAATAQDEHPSGDGRRTVAQLPANLLRATLGVFSTDSVKPVLVGGAATGIGALFDDAVADALVDGSNDFSQAVETGSEPAWTAGVIGALFVAGRFAHGARFRAVTYDWVDACLVAAGYTELLKRVVGRERPNGMDDKSFPSGHTSNAFALAVVAERHYGWKAGVPAYALASVVALSRLQQNEHYLSDVIAGATLGYIVGRTVVRINNRAKAPRQADWGLSPVLARRTRALVIQVSF
jgi:membrane-associated phospholipid phosphatase